MRPPRTRPSRTSARKRRTVATSASNPWFPLPEAHGHPSPQDERDVSRGQTSVRRLRTMARKKITIRPPGLKPTTKVGTLGPYRGRLGLAWVIAPILVGVVILVAGYLAIVR